MVAPPTMVAMAIVADKVAKAAGGKHPLKSLPTKNADLYAKNSSVPSLLFSSLSPRRLHSPTASNSLLLPIPALQMYPTLMLGAAHPDFYDRFRHCRTAPWTKIIDFQGVIRLFHLHTHIIDGLTYFAWGSHPLHSAVFTVTSNLIHYSSIARICNLEVPVLLAAYCSVAIHLEN